MAELAVASSVGGLLSITIQVIQVSKEYISSVRNASKTIRGYFRELEIMRLVLEDLHGFLAQQEEPNVDLRPIHACFEELENLHCKLQRRLNAATKRGNVSRFTWPFAEDETRRLTEVLHRYQSSLHLLLATQNHRLATNTLAAIEAVEARQEQASKDRILQWLSVADPLVNHTAARDKHEPDTGEWFLQSAAFNNWKTGDSCSCLWLRSIPGAGKTVLCATIVDHLLHNQKADEFLLFFYFDFRDEQKQTLAALLRSLIAQICVRADYVPAELQMVFDKSAPCTTRDLVKMFESMVAGRLNVKIVIDALDESTERTSIVEFLAHITRSKILVETIQWLVTSRNEQDIEATLGACDPTVVSLDKVLVNKDIQRHIESCLSRDPVLRARPAWVKQKISDTLLAKADGMFQYVQCQLGVLRNCLNGPAIETALTDLPAGIDETYDRILLSIAFENWEQVRRVLLLLAFAMRPISIEEVAEFAIIAGVYRPFDPQDRLFDPNDIISLAAGLVVFDETNNALILAHYSVQEYLVSDRIQAGRARFFALDEASAHRYVAQACVSYILSVAELTVGYHGVTDDYPFLQYACQNWEQHAQPSIADVKSGTLELALHILDGRKGAHKFWITYHEDLRKNNLALESLFAATPLEQSLAILRYPGFVYLPGGALLPGVHYLFQRLSFNDGPPTTARKNLIFENMIEALRIARGVSAPESKSIRLAMFHHVCFHQRKNPAIDWEPVNRPLYLALFEPLDILGTNNHPEKCSIEEVDQRLLSLRRKRSHGEISKSYDYDLVPAVKYMRRCVIQEAMIQQTLDHEVVA